LRMGYTLTQKKAWDKYGISRLSAIILALRNEGYKIKSESKVVTNRQGKKVAVAEYSIPKKVPKEPGIF
ncbi:MAG: helix-turn-helix domain-containing protein, partial [Clostridiales bacterium]|nr:helix-turn-helix domain-containing protein [Clostridiales bacterium]